MKSAATHKAALHSTPVSATSPLSHIPLPRRKNSSKGDKGLDVVDTDSEYSNDAIATRSQAKMSLLGSTSFCCASGQKEDYIPDARILPASKPPKKRPPNIAVKKECDPSTPKTPLLTSGKGLLVKSKKGKINQDGSDEVQTPLNENGPVKTSTEDIKTRSANPDIDSRLRPVEERRKITPPSPQRRIHREAGIPRKDHSDVRKYPESPRKHRKDSNVSAPNQTVEAASANVKKCKHANEKLHSIDQHLLEAKAGNFATISERPEKCDLIFNACDVTQNELASKEPTVQNGNSDNVVDCTDVLNKSHESEDFDCPCCDRTSAMMDDTGLSDIEVKMFTSCDVIAPTEETQELNQVKDTCDSTEQMLQLEVKSLKEELQAGKLKLQSQQVRVRHLEEELGVMQQLRQELDKEKELRKIAEDKLLELLDYEKRMEVQKRENEKRMESRGTQVDSTETAPNPPSSEPGSPLLLGYDGRLRKYQTYIAKLENDNLMLVNELKKFKDMSPRSQEEQAKVLVEKLGQMERNNQQQQIQYETCLDEVANKLVQTLLAQKRLEEECKVLHLRVEQLEQENVTLMELMDKEKEEKAEKVDSMKSEQMNSYIQLRKPSHHPLTSSPVKKSSVTQKSSISSEEQKDPPKSTNLSPIKSVYSEPRSPVTSPTAKVGCASKIPSFSSSKPVLVRKKSETDMQPPRKSRNEALSRETSSSDLVPNSKPSSALPSLRNKPQSTPKGPKGSSAKRKRLSRTESPAEKGAKDSKQRIKSNHIRWDSRKVSSEEMTPSYSGKECVNQISPIPTFPQPQHVWSFNCELSTSMSVPEIKRKVAASIDALKLDMELGVDRPEDDLNSKQSSSTSESSTTIEGGNRTRDEGYSTMSSDLQPDSAADTTISEPEHSATYVITEKDICNSDDSVTECLDGSMCSSSDSGFGPLHQVATPRAANGFEEEPSRTINELPKFDAAGRKLGTVKCKEQIASVKPTIRSTGNVFDQNSMLSDNKSDSVCDKFLSDSGTLKHESSKAFQEFDRFSPSKLPNDQKLSGVDQSTMIDYINFPKEIMGLTNYRNSWHLGHTKSICDDKIVFCTRHSYIDDNLYDDRVETAEKATLTEPEEELWREKALAPFIDESIWSLYSSEGDIQVKHFPIEPLLSEPSLEKLINNCSPCIVVTENVDSIPQDEAFQASAIKSSTNSSVTELNNLTGQNTEQFKPGLERVASDTVLYLKDAIHELEDSMRRGLKSSKNIPALHQNSGSESESSPTGGISFKPEILRTLESTMAGQDHLAWPSPTRSSSLSSVQSCVSCHVVSDEMEDVDLVRTSQKGSRDNDLNSASDAEYENLDHRDFVERWLQKEIVFNNSPKLTVSHLEPVAEIGEYPLPSVETRISPPSRTRFSPYPNESKETNAIISLLPIQKTDNISPTQSDVISSEPLFESDACVAECIPDCPEDVDVECLDPEATEFNGDFYTLCSIGSLKSLDRFSPSKTRDMTVKQLVESPIFNRKAPPKSLSKSSADKLKPTGLVKPTRPVSLSFVSVPSVPEHSLQKSSPTVTDPGSKESDCHAKTSICTKVPPNNFSVCQSDAENKKSPVSECSSSEKSPVSCLPVRIASVSVKPKSPTKIVFRSGSPSKSEDASKRQQWKRDRLVSRRSHLKEGCGTAWIHLQPNPALSDPSVRSNLLDSLKAPTSSSGSSGTEEEDNEVLVIQTNSHLHRICKERRHKAKASANNPLYDMKKRSSIVGRRELFYRFGDKEKEAIACFDFLEEIPSVESLNKPTTPPEETPPIPPSNLSLSCRQISSIKERISLVSPTIGNHSKSVATADPPSKMTDLAKSPFSNYSARKLRLPNLWNKPLSHNMSSSTLNSQDCELLDHISLSDSCAESYSSTPESYDDVS
ncbi:uncharacterized protein LOC129983723 isoform X1 [Argiope bruennichi]|uniref:uncharacterized protein LOC129983723 isoform X1 n=1 Tax=Argiope bruennichi TaxID=94029 RepID=UPI0024947B3E|nr:uncharacterized protein LOC129983723 isoform X1 [Argiope bruennichi]